MKNVVVTFIPLFNIILLLLISVFKQKYFMLMMIIGREWCRYTHVVVMT